MGLVFYIALTFTVFLVLALLLAPVILRPSPAARRIMEMVQSNRPDVRNVGAKERMQETILSWQEVCGSGSGWPRTKKSSSNS